jgi:hypothetical protein
MSQPAFSLVAPPPSSHAPRAHIDPIDNAADALAVVHLALRHPLQPEIIAFVLDGDKRGSVIVSVTDVDDDDAVFRVVDLMCQALAGSRARSAEPDREVEPTGFGLVVATVRPEGGVVTGDTYRWLEAGSIAADHGVELVEWFVIGPDGPACPRALLGEPERW